MRILMQNRDYNSPDNPNGGDMVLARGISEGLRKLGHEVDESSSLEPNLSNYDLVHIWHINFPWSYFQADNAQRQEKPYIFSSIFYPHIIQEHLKEMLDGASAVCVNSQTELSLLDHEYKEEFFGEKQLNYKIIPSSIDDKFSRNKVCAVSRIEDHKNPLPIVEACNNLLLELWMAGPSTNKGLANELEKKGARLTGNLDKEELQKLYLESRVFISTSLGERDSVSAREAKAMGCKIVMTKENLANDTLKPDAIIDPKDVNDITNKLKEVYEDYPLTHFEAAKKYLEIYEEATAL
jgi:glycosyltransferase involved in cell wall biosynthesis